MSAFGRLGQPGEIAAVVFLPGQRRGRLVTAQNIRINGGPPDRGGDRGHERSLRGRDGSFGPAPFFASVADEWATEAWRDR